MGRQKKTIGIGDDVSFASMEALAGDRSRASPPACVVEAVWLLMTAAVGLATPAERKF